MLCVSRKSYSPDLICNTLVLQRKRLAKRAPAQTIGSNSRRHYSEILPDGNFNDQPFTTQDTSGPTDVVNHTYNEITNDDSTQTTTSHRGRHKTSTHTQESTPNPICRGTIWRYRCSMAETIPATWRRSIMYCIHPHPFQVRPTLRCTLRLTRTDLQIEAVQRTPRLR